MSIFDPEYVARVVAQGKVDAVAYASRECNGWSNHPTWNAALVLDNDPAAYREVRERVAEALGAEGDIAELDPERRLFVAVKCEPEFRSLFAVADVVRDVAQVVCNDYLICEPLVNWCEVAALIVDDLEGSDA